MWYRWIRFLKQLLKPADLLFRGVARRGMSFPNFRSYWGGRENLEKTCPTTPFSTAVTPKIK
jgi:hypothetical protein